MQINALIRDISVLRGDLNAKKLYSRELYLNKIRPFYHENDLIKVITGVRRFLFR